MKHCYRAGIDIGSTTAKLVILDERGVLCYGDYRRHCAHTQETLAELLEDACAKLGPCDLRLKITGSGAINLGKALNIGFVQEVVAVASSLQALPRRRTSPLSWAVRMRRSSISKAVMWNSV